MVTGQRSYAIGIDRRIKIFWCTFALMVVLFSTYATLLNMTIANVVFVEESGKNIEKVSSEVAHLEEMYLNESKVITIEKALALGLIEDKAPSYIKVSKIKGEVSLGGVVTP